MSDASTISDIRLELAGARANLRAAEDQYEQDKLMAELARGESVAWDAKALGANAEERKVRFAAAVEADPATQASRGEYRAAQYEVERLQATLDGLLDVRRQQDMELRERNIALLEGWQADGGKTIGEGDNAQPTLFS